MVRPRARRLKSLDVASSEKSKKTPPERASRRAAGGKGHSVNLIDFVVRSALPRTRETVSFVQGASKLDLGWTIRERCEAAHITLADARDTPLSDPRLCPERATDLIHAAF